MKIPAHDIGASRRAYRHRLQFLLKPRLRPHCGAGAVRAAAAQQADYILDPPVTREQLEDPAHIGGKTAASTDVQVGAHGGEEVLLSSSTFMQDTVSLAQAKS